MTSTTPRVVANETTVRRSSDPQLLILASLADGPQHGHSMLRKIAALYGAKLGPGALYGAIARLESKGLIEALPAQDRRRPYKITESGLLLLETQRTTMRRITGDATPETTAAATQRPPMPSFYEIEPDEELVLEIDQPESKTVDYNADQLPFKELGGRRFEVLTYLLKQEEFPEGKAVLVKSSRDRGRDVLVHQDGRLHTVVQCKNLDHKFSRPEVIEELVKLALYDYLDRFIPKEGITYEIWAPGGLTDQAESLVANWPTQITESDLILASDKMVQFYKSLRDLNSEEVIRFVSETLSKRIRLIRYDSPLLSHKVRACQEVFLRFFEATVVMKQEHVDAYFDKKLTIARTDQNQFTEQLANLTARFDGDSIDEAINEARDLINARHLRDAAVVLKRLQAKKGSILNKHQKYRIISNFGAIALGEGKPEDAARHFLEAVLLEPDEELARVNEVFAYLLLGNMEKTFELASQRRSKYPYSARLAAMWIMSAPSATLVHELEEGLDTAVIANHEVCVALARRYMIAHLLEKARDYADKAIASGPTWSQPWLVRAQVALGKLIEEHTGLKPLAEDRKQLLSGALADATKAIELAESEGGWIKAEALVARAELYLLSGERNEASDDANAAYKLDSENLNALLSVAQCHLVAGALERGLEVLAHAHQKEARPDVVMLYAQALSERAQEGDLIKAAEITGAMNLDSVTPFVRPAVAISTVRYMVRRSDWGAADSYLTRFASILDPAAIYSLKSLVSHGRGELEEANLAADTAIRELTSETQAAVKDFLAGMLMRLGRPADALSLFQELFDQRVPSFDPSYLLDCAAKLHLDDKILEICESLHERRLPEWPLLEFEVQYLEKWDKQKAIARIEEFLDAHPGHKLAQLRLSVIGSLHRRPELVRSSIDDLPSVEELPIEYLLPALGILKHGDDRHLAIDYAYRFLRSHYDRQEAHEAYIQTVLTTPARPFPPELEIVEPGCAVLCQEVPNGDLRWFVLEDTDKPSRDFEELSRSDSIVAEVIAKHVDETFVLARGSMANREAVVKKILPKYVRRFQDCASELQVRFGPSAMLQSVQIGSEGAIHQPGLVSMMNSVQRRAKQVDLMQSWYTDQPLSLHLYGAKFGHNAYVGLQHIAQTEGLAVKCSEGNPGEAEIVLSFLRERPTIVIDLSAVATIRLLGLERVLGTKQYKFVASQATWEELQETLQDIEVGGQHAGTMSFQEGVYVMQEVDAATLARRKAEDQAFLDSFYANVEIQSARDLAGVELDVRELLVNYLGQYGAETTVLARSPQMIMWTDDSILAQLAASTFGTRRTWTQLVLLSLVEAGLLASDDYNKAVAKLIGMGFTSTFFDANCMIEGARIAQFRASWFPLKQMAEAFQKTNAPAQGLVRQFLQFFVLLQQEPLLHPQKSLIVREFLDSLWRNPASHNMVLAMRSMSAKLFGLNVVAENEFNLTFDAWFRGLSRPII